ncbi:MAG TPA: LysM peptidoglycan-binding domain-containing protein [Thermoanaerobaculia bacterium]
MTAEKPAETKPAEKKPAAKTASKATTKSTHPPRELHKVGDHWTAYNPPDPSTYPANSKTYAIKAGDTLWALGKQFYGNSYLWPQLWEANTWITDAHWIYPGDVLLIEGEITGTAQTATTQTGTGGAAVSGGTTGEAQTQPGQGTALGTPGEFRYRNAAEAVPGSAGPVALASESDLYCYGYIGDANEPMPNRIAGWEDVEVRYQPGATRQEIDGSQGDLVFIDGGTSTGLAAGESYILVEPRELISNPATQDVIGREYEYVGQLRVLCAEATRSRAIITQSCKEIPIGAGLKPIPQIPIPLARIPSLPGFCDPASAKATGYIIASQGGAWLESLGDGQLVQINLGRDEQVQPGEFLTVFRDTNTGDVHDQRQVLGELAVLTSENHTSTARIVMMRRAMKIGDRVEIR